ncbi:MAG TPA: DUF2332 family protein, partial [Devosia sp.]|nr:DUF2332 family protein [Devosia sp.]
MEMTREEKVRESFATQAHWCSKLGSPFTARLLEQLGQKLDHSTQTGRMLLGWKGISHGTSDAIALRLAGALHGLVRAGRLSELAALYPPNPLPDGDILAEVAIAGIVEADEEICEWLAFAPQTNEVARASLLYSGMRVIAGETTLPLSLFELGASAGLNLMLDKFAYRLGDRNFGETGSRVLLSPQWVGPAPKGAAPDILARRGCDLNPLDVTVATHRARLLAYIWADQSERLARTEAAIRIAQAAPPRLDKADAGAWVESNILPKGKSGTSRVLFHSIAYQYFPEAVKNKIEANMEAAGAQATPQAPLAW